ncbi:MAG: DUF502 domain-containing protein [Candidatus Comchoanobacterales bacterium]
MNFAWLKKIVFAGLLFWVPFASTLVIVRFVMGMFDNLPNHLLKMFVYLGVYSEGTLLNETFLSFPGLGLFLAALVVLVTGALIANFFGKRLVSAWNKMIAHIPVVNTIYHGIRQTVEVLMKPGNKSFSEVVKVEYPRRGMWSIGFVTSKTFRINDKQENFVSVFVATTPNPTSGFILLVPPEDLIPLDITVDEALKYIISLGTVSPQKDTLDEE